MTSRDKRVLAIGAAIAVLLTAFPIAVDRTTPRTGLVRTFFAQVGFGGVPVEERTSEINLRFLDEQPNLPRQNFSARWRGFFFLAEPQTVEFFAGGNDEVELRVDGETLIRRSLSEGLRTIGRRVRLEAGSHAFAIDYQQFGGSMALNIQRSLEGQPPSPFLPEELFAEPVDAWHVVVINAARGVRRVTPDIWLAFIALVAGTLAAVNFRTWRATAAPQSVRQYLARLWLFAVPALLAPAVIFGLGPHTIFSNNTAEFAVGYRELASPWLLRTIGMNWLILFAIGCVVALISEQAARVYAALLFVAGVLFWGQGNIWNADYGVLAGQDLDLTQHAARAPYERAGWAGVLLLALIFFRPLSRIAPFASLVFLLVQTAGATVTGTDSTTAERVRWIEAPPAIFQFSSAQNVIHIVLDEFQADVFADIFRQDRQTLDRQFSGFQYFIDHAGSFPTTSFSMPAMLAAREYRNEKPAPEFVRDAFKEASIFEKVARAGYDVDATTIVPIDSFEQWLGPEDKPNWNGSRFRIRKPYVSREDYREVTSRQLLELSLFRHVPHDAKQMSVKRPAAFYRPIWMDRTESPAQVRRHEASNSVAFLEQFIETMSIGRDRPVYKLLHDGVPHRPIVVDRDCRFIGLTDMSRDSYTEQSRCAVKLVAAFLDRARALG
ncbi:MAG TPA: PA14 domain-containing protein, partial [Vicinamibacterales bacterium]|nr:PA14 domain-containing protein [Vicinamibacterales bacterium]